MFCWPLAARTKDIRHSPAVIFMPLDVPGMICCFFSSFLSPEEDWIFRHPSVAEYNPTSGEYCQLTALIIDNSLFFLAKVVLEKDGTCIFFFPLHLGQMLKSVKLSKWDRNVWLISSGSQIKERWKGGWRGYFVNNFNSMKYDLNHKQVLFKFITWGNVFYWNEQIKF